MFLAGGFTALLKTEDDEIMAEGTAKISIQNHSVEFHSDFVPIMLFGTKAKIVRLDGETEAQCFEGTVYLSAHTLLRIVNVDERLLAELEFESLQSISFDAKASPILFRNGAMQLVAERLLKYDIQIFMISLSKLRFVSEEQFMVGDCLQISIGTPLVVKKMAVRIIQTLLFGEVKTVYRCDMLALPEPGRSALVEYLAQNQPHANAELMEDEDIFSI